MKRILFAALALASTLTASPAVAQLAPFNEAGLTMGHWHIATKNVEAEKQLFLAMGGKLYNPGGQPLIAFPGLYISLILGTEKGSCPFEYAVPLNETMNLGVVAMRADQAIDWDGGACKVTNVAAANNALGRDYRKGWEL